jgi:hypothetical protein
MRSGGTPALIAAYSWDTGRCVATAARKLVRCTQHGEATLLPTRAKDVPVLPASCATASRAMIAVQRVRIAITSTRTR